MDLFLFAPAKGRFVFTEPKSNLRQARVKVRSPFGHFVRFVRSERCALFALFVRCERFLFGSFRCPSKAAFSQR